MGTICVSSFALVVVPAWQHPQTTNVYPLPGRAWGMGVVRGFARAVLARPPSPFVSLSCLLRHSSLRQRRLCPIRLPFILFSILSSIILWVYLMLGWYCRWQEAHLHCVWCLWGKLTECHFTMLTED